MAWSGVRQFVRFAATPAWTRGGPEKRAERRRVRRGLHMAESGEPVAVFMIGARINRLRKVRSWLPVVAAMPAMLKELADDPDSGLLGYRLLMGPDLGEVTIVQYWRRTGDIRAFAGDADRGHLPAEQAFWARYAKSDGAIGIWHEMYSVRAGAYHALYGDMHATGLGAFRDTKSLEYSGHGNPVPVGE
ncbi:DUF4188 domain-containing protein [Streptomyces sp. NPDC048604]|uniref:DUF4188 domain-containing protein n=1 Tax=Streptomyces sp. NPDC048604 TaxID=3365578 RepID=UPI0037130F5D